MFAINNNGDDMKKIIFVCVMILLIFLACSEDENDVMSNGIITGVDSWEYLCCGGYFIDINSSTYRFRLLPAGSNVIRENPIFPIYVKLDWAIEDSLCLGDEVRVFKIQLR